MPIMSLDEEPQEVGTHEYRTQEELKTSTVFDKELSVDKIKYQVDGMRWSVDYFNQILGINTQPIAPDLNIPNTTLKYNRIDNLDIYVDSGLPDGTVTGITGTGIINAGVVPYLGDAFVATLAGGRLGILVITEVRKEYYNTHDIYAIDFKLTYFLDTSPANHNDLVYKTVRTYIYDREAVNTNSSPILLAKDYKVRLDLAKEPVKIMNHYLNLFYDKNTKLLRLPTVASVYVDQLVTEAVFSLVSVRDVPELSEVSRLASNTDSVTLWDALLSRDMSLFEIANYDIRYSITSVGGVTEKISSYLGVEYGVTDKPTSSITPTVKPNPLADRFTGIPPVTNRDVNYIFSKDFYAQTPGVVFSPLEVAVITYLQGKPPLRSDLETILKEYKYWDYQDQYVLLPIVLILVKALVSNNYSSI